MMRFAPLSLLALWPACVPIALADNTVQAAEPITLQVAQAAPPKSWPAHCKRCCNPQ